LQDSSSQAPTRTLEARAGGPTNLDEFINGSEFGPEGDLVDVDVDAAREPKPRKLIHQASRRVTGRAAADQELFDRLSTEFGLENCQQSKKEIRRLQAASRANRTRRHQQFQERLESTALLEDRERMLHDLTELNDMNRLLITRISKSRGLGGRFRG